MEPKKQHAHHQQPLSAQPVHNEESRVTTRIDGHSSMRITESSCEDINVSSCKCSFCTCSLQKVYGRTRV
eukprot:1141549-Pelagomonas_calceolata.AAC.13